MVYLYLKTHNVTGLKYLGQTKQNPRIYLGSGTRWLFHLRKHGNDITTEILKKCTTYDQLKKWGLYYSDLWKVIKSNDFANLIKETGHEYYEPMSPRTQDNSRRIGSFWVTDGKNNKLLLQKQPIPIGFKRGRKVNPTSIETRQKMSESALKRKKKEQHYYDYKCDYCNQNFKRKNIVKTELKFCSRKCRGKALPNIANPTGYNQYTNI